MSWIRSVAPEEAEGELARSYAAAVKRAGRVFQIVRAMSLAPRVLDASMGFYLAIMHARGALSRRQRELLAVVTSGVNRCHY
ncbi:MAG: carboxymuconolactone decarboxylase family protein [Planctomycetes bacterium]|nr:carboxymuconolactone decarboxylase family protein [Planctomycetota bacterium]